MSTLVDTNGDRVRDTTFAVAMLTAETVRINPVRTEAQIKAQKDIVERISIQSGT